MLILYRKSGQGIEVQNKVNGEKYDFDFLYNESPMTKYRINGKECERQEREPFYLDPNCEVMIIIIHSDSAIRVGIDAPRHWNIRRKEIKSEVETDG